MFFVVETTVGMIQPLCAEAETPFCTSATLVSITEKPVGEAPTGFLGTTQQIHLNKISYLLFNVRIARNNPLRTSSPPPKVDVLPLFHTIPKNKKAALIKQDELYRVVSIAAPAK
jgi:hypothetical protein